MIRKQNYSSVIGKLSVLTSKASMDCSSHLAV